MGNEVEDNVGDNDSWAALVALDEEEDPELEIIDLAEKRGLKRLHGQQVNENGDGHGRVCDFERETDPATLARRTKQIQYGKGSIEYQNYIKLISKEERDEVHPRTPNIKRKYSRRAFDGLVRQWRLNLHAFSQVNPLADFYAGGRRTPSSSVSAVSTTTTETGESTSDDEDEPSDHPDHNDKADDDEDKHEEEVENNNPVEEQDSCTASPSTNNPKSRRRLL